MPFSSPFALDFRVSVPFIQHIVGFLVLFAQLVYFPACTMCRIMSKCDDRDETSSIFEYCFLGLIDVRTCFDFVFFLSSKCVFSTWSFTDSNYTPP